MFVLRYTGQSVNWLNPKSIHADVHISCRVKCWLTVHPQGLTINHNVRFKSSQELLLHLSLPILLLYLYSV